MQAVYWDAERRQDILGATQSPAYTAPLPKVLWSIKYVNFKSLLQKTTDNSNSFSSQSASLPCHCSPIVNLPSWEHLTAQFPNVPTSSLSSITPVLRCSSCSKLSPWGDLVYKQCMLSDTGGHPADFLQGQMTNIKICYNYQGQKQNNNKIEDTTIPQTTVPIVT